MYLYLDTTNGLTVGLLDMNLSWKEFFFDSKTLVSSHLHFMIYELLEKYQLDIQKLSGVIYCAGPGSYTGMRVAEGFGQILNWQRVPTYTIYQHHIPRLAGIKSGVWIGNAFKGEYFLFDWNLAVESTQLIKKEDLSNLLEKKQIYSGKEVEGIKTQLTHEVLKENASLFRTILNQKKPLDLFYYRDLEKEFSRC